MGLVGSNQDWGEDDVNKSSPQVNKHFYVIPSCQLKKKKHLIIFCRLTETVCFFIICMFVLNSPVTHDDCFAGLWGETKMWIEVLWLMQPCVIPGQRNREWRRRQQLEGPEISPKLCLLWVDVGRRRNTSLGCSRRTDNVAAQGVSVKNIQASCLSVCRRNVTAEPLPA